TLEGPRERRGRGLVAGADHRHELVAQLLVGHRPAVLVGGLQQQRENIVALAHRALLAPPRDLLVQEGVQRGPGAPEPCPRAPWAEVMTDEAKQRDRMRAPRELAHERLRAPEALVVANAKHRAQD